MANTFYISKKYLFSVVIMSRGFTLALITDWITVLRR